MNVRSMLLCTTTISLLTFNAAVAQQLPTPPKTYAVRGSVADSDGKPIASVLIKVYREGRLVDHGIRSDGKGQYELMVTEGSPIDAIIYDHTFYHPTVVTGLSGKNIQEINKIMYGQKESLSAQAFLEQSAAYQQIAVMYLSEPSGESYTIEEVRGLASKLETLTLPAKTNKSVEMAAEISLTSVKHIYMSLFGDQDVVQPPNPQRGPGLPQPGPEHKLLAEMAGSWDCKVTTEGVPGESKGSAVSRMDLNGLWLSTEFESDFGGMTFQGKSLDGYDPGKKKFINIWVDSMSTAPVVMEGTYDEETKTLTLTGEGPGVDGKTAKYKTTTAHLDKDHQVYKMYLLDDDNKETLLMTIEYLRRK